MDICKCAHKWGFAYRMKAVVFLFMTRGSSAHKAIALHLLFTIYLFKNFQFSSQAIDALWCNSSVTPYE